MISLLICSALAEEPAPTPLLEEPQEAVVAVTPLHPGFPDAPTGPGQVTPDSPHYDLEEMYAAGQHEKGIEIARERLQVDPDDAVLVWMVVRFTFQYMEEFDRTDDSLDKEAVYRELIALCDAALEKHPGDPHLLFARGVAKGRLGTTRGVLASLFMAKDVEADWVGAAESNYEYMSIMGAERLPCDVHLGLSIFYRLVPDWWIVKAIAGTRGDLDKALQHAETANTCAPNVIRNLKELGVAKICLGAKRGDDELIEAGRANIREYTKLVPYSNTERIDMDHAQKILDMRPKDACGYSRDGQQDLDEKNLEKQQSN